MARFTNRKIQKIKKIKNSHASLHSIIMMIIYFILLLGHLMLLQLYYNSQFPVCIKYLKKNKFHIVKKRENFHFIRNDTSVKGGMRVRSSEMVFLYPLKFHVISCFITLSWRQKCCNFQSVSISVRYKILQQCLIPFCIPHHSFLSLKDKFQAHKLQLKSVIEIMDTYRQCGVH
jgi:hypothetical protein